MWDSFKHNPSYLTCRSRVMVFPYIWDHTVSTAYIVKCERILFWPQSLHYNEISIETYCHESQTACILRKDSNFLHEDQQINVLTVWNTANF